MPLIAMASALRYASYITAIFHICLMAASSRNVGLIFATGHYFHAGAADYRAPALLGQI